MAVNQNKLYLVQNGMQVMDGISEGPIYTGGVISPVGLDFPVGTIYVQNVTGGGILWRKWNTGVNDWQREVTNDFYQKSVATAETSTTSTTVFSNKLTITTPSLPIGNYELKFMFKWRLAAANRAQDVRIQRNAANALAFVNFSPNVAEASVSSGFLTFDAISGVQTFTLDFKVNGSGTTAFMSYSYMDFRRVT